MHRKDHWERVYTTKGERDVSWFESLPASHTMFPLFSIAYRAISLSNSPPLD